MPLSFHANNIEHNGLKLTRNQLKWILQKIRENKFPSDDIFTKDISKITITFDININMTNLPLCYKYINTINPDKKNKQDKYIIFTTNFQMNLLSKCTQIHIDGTFKSCPRGYYQILNIAGYYPDINGIIPIFFIPITGKSQYIYDCIFKDIKKILEDNGINQNDIPIKFMIDFEKGLQNALKINFPNCKVGGCFFHFVKLLWTKVKSLGLCNKSNLKLTKIIVFILKLIPFTDIDNKSFIFKKVEEYMSLQNDNYKKLISYYKKNWLENNYINYCEITNDEYYNRTNNYIESFHSYMNNTLDCFHPKISYLIHKYKEYLIKIYEKIKNCFVNKIEIKHEKFSIINDILTFITNYNKKYRTNIDINIIIQSEEEDFNIIIKVCDYMLDLFLDIYENDLDLEEKNDNNSLDEEYVSFFNANKNEFEDSFKNEESEAKESAEIINLDEFFPKFKIKKKKRTYKEAIGHDNELNIFWDRINLYNISLSNQNL